MDRRLIDAAKKGDVEQLHNLIKDNPLLLSTAAIVDGQTPLHIACIAGHLQFVREVLILGLDFVEEINQDGFTPLHIASARGDVEIVRELLKVGTHLCLLKGKDRRIPLHSAVAKGRIHVITELLQPCSDSIEQVTARGETCLHLAVKNNQYEALEVLCQHVVSFDKEDVLNSKDDRGNTLLHLAASRKLYEVIFSLFLFSFFSFIYMYSTNILMNSQVFDLLLEGNSWCKERLDVNSLNRSGLTPFDILISDGGDSEIEEMLTLAGASPSNTLIRVQHQSSSGPEQEQRRERDHERSASQKLQDYFKYDKIKESPGQARNTLLVITVLIATATYQAVLSPPGGVWEDDYWADPAQNNNGSSKQPPRHTAGKSVMSTHNYVSYGLFLLFNSIGFFMSLHMMNFLTVGLPLQFELRVALFALTATYDTCMFAIAPSGKISTFFIVLSIMMPLIMIVLTKVVRDYNKGWRCERRRVRVTASSA